MYASNICILDTYFSKSKSNNTAKIKNTCIYIQNICLRTCTYKIIYLYKIKHISKIAVTLAAFIAIFLPTVCILKMFIYFQLLFLSTICSGCCQANSKHPWKKTLTVIIAKAINFTLKILLKSSRNNITNIKYNL